MTFVRLIALLLAIPLFAACSKTVQWEEEVPLNTGETIWVKRSMPWVYKGGMGNPFDMAMRASFLQTISFKHSGKDSRYTGKAQVLWIAISPSGQPVLVANPGFSGWATENLFPCVVPYYVQLVPDITGQIWTWPEKIEPWLYGLQANLMVVIPQLSERHQVRYSKKERDERDADYRRETADSYRINSLYDAHGRCPTKYDPSMKPTKTWSEK
jgi:hypothetical protein